MGMIGICYEQKNQGKRMGVKIKVFGMPTGGCRVSFCGGAECFGYENLCRDPKFIQNRERVLSEK